MTYNTGNNVFYANGRREEYPSNTPFGTAPPDPVVAADIVAVVAQLDQMATQVPVDRPYDAPNAEDYDRQTLETWLREHSSGSPEFLALASAATSAIFGAEPRDISLLFTLFYIAASATRTTRGRSSATSTPPAGLRSSASSAAPRRSASGWPSSSGSASTSRCRCGGSSSAAIGSASRRMA